eukprot:gene14418-biopygen10888
MFSWRPRRPVAARAGCPWIPRPSSHRRPATAAPPSFTSGPSSSPSSRRKLPARPCGVQAAGRRGGGEEQQGGEGALAHIAAVPTHPKRPRWGQEGRRSQLLGASGPGLARHEAGCGAPTRAAKSPPGRGDAPEGGCRPATMRRRGAAGGYDPAPPSPPASSPPPPPAGSGEGRGSGAQPAAGPALHQRKKARDGGGGAAGGQSHQLS